MLGTLKYFLKTERIYYNSVKCKNIKFNQYFRIYYIEYLWNAFNLISMYVYNFKVPLSVYEYWL